MIVGAAQAIHETMYEEVKQHAREITMRNALAELIPFLQFGHRYAFVISEEIVTIGNPKIYDEYRVMIRIEDMTARQS